MSYFVIELCSIGGCPLEEASENYSLNNKIIAILCSGYIFFAYFVFSVSFSSHILYLGIALQVKSITYVGMDLRGDPDLVLPDGEQWGAIGKIFDHIIVY